MFAVDGNNALVWSRKRGWGWMSRLDEDGTFHALHDVFEQTRAETNREAQQHDASGTATHTRMLLVIEAQAVRSEPKDEAQILAHVPELSSCGGTDEPQRGAPVQVVSTRGDWAQVIVAAKSDFDSNDAFTKRVRWPTAPAGWVRLHEPGSAPGTRLRLWCTERWGPWP